MPSSRPALQPANVAVITGAAGGGGLAAARELAEFGLRPCLADHDAEAPAEAAESIEGALPVPTDVSDHASVEALAQAAISRFGRVSVLMNNAVPVGVATRCRIWKAGCACSAPISSACRLSCPRWRTAARPGW